MRHFIDFQKAKNKQQTKRRDGRTLRFETFEPRMLLSCNTISGSHPSAILPEQTTGFIAVDHSAAIDLAQTDQVISIAIGSGEASAQSPIHYASPSGGGNGTLGSPWSLAQANSQLLAGDTLYLTAGNYVGQIKPVRSGTAGNPIRIMAAPGLSPEQVHVRGTTTATSSGSRFARAPAIRISTNYVLVEGFTVSYTNGLQALQDGSNVTVDGQHITIRNMRIIHDASVAEGTVPAGKFGEHVCQARQSGRPREWGVILKGKFNLAQNNFIKNMFIGLNLGTDKAGSSFNVVRGNTIADPAWDGIHIGTGNGAPLNHLIENNVIFGGQVSDGITFNGRASSDPSDHLGINQVIVRNNAIFNNTENNIDLKATQNIVVEGNFLWSAIGDNDGSGAVTNNSSNWNINDESGGSGITKGNGTESTHVIIRNNVMIDNNQAAFTETDYKIYNNTLLNNRRNFGGPNQPTAPLTSRKPGDSAVKAGRTGPNAAILNNIAGDHGYEISLRSSGSVAIDGNTYYNTFQTTRFAQFNDNNDWIRHSTLAAWQSWLQTKSNFTGNEANSQVIAGGPSALFVNVPGQPTGDPAQFDFRLKENSPAIDSGVFLTKTSGSGSGTSMSVGDAKLFFDGYGITLGDEIQLEGQTQRARITNISGNTLTLDNPLSWSHGQGVSLSYKGAKPDAGAIEFAGPIGPLPPTAVDDSAVTAVNTAVTTPNVLANDHDPNPGDVLSVQSFTQPANGTVAPNGDGTFLYTPNAGFHGSDSFAYVLSDGAGGTDTGTVNITVTPPGVSFSEDFSSPSDLGNFSIVSGGTWAIAGGQLQLTNPANGSPLGNVILHNTPTPGDFTIDIDSELVAPTSTWGDFNVVFNYQDANHYYFANFNQRNSDGTTGILKYEDGVLTELADFGDANNISVGTGYEIQVVRTGDLIEVYRDSVLLASITDGSFVGGQMGLASKNDGVAFDNLLVNNIIEITGDFDTDGDVDGADFLAWQRGFGSAYDADDLTDWEDNFVASASSAAASTVATPLAVAAPAPAATVEVEPASSDVGVILAPDLQSPTETRQSVEIVVDDALFDDGEVLSVDVALAQPMEQGVETSTPFDFELDSAEAEEANEVALDVLFDLLGSSVD